MGVICVGFKRSLPSFSTLTFGRFIVKADHLQNGLLTIGKKGLCMLRICYTDIRTSKCSPFVIILLINILYSSAIIIKALCYGCIHVTIVAHANEVWSTRKKKKSPVHFFLPTELTYRTSSCADKEDFWNFHPHHHPHLHPN